MFSEESLEILQENAEYIKANIKIEAYPISDFKDMILSLCDCIIDETHMHLM